MKKLSYVILLSIISIFLLSCSEEMVSPADVDNKEEVAPVDKESTEGGEPATNGGVKG